MTPPALTVVALGGNAISPPRGNLDMAGERAAVARVAAELAVLLDVHVAQTQGELRWAA